MRLLLVYALLAGLTFAQVAQPVAFVSLPFDPVNGLLVRSLELRL